MNDRYELAVIGAGPAGLAAATMAASHGAKVALFDEQSAPGGQIYRALETVSEDRAALLGPDYTKGRKLIEAFRVSSVDYYPKTTVWSLNPGLELGLLCNGSARLLGAQRVIIANGAQERPVPFPRWTLAGVMYAGAAQVLLKSGGLVPSEGVVLAGSSPLLLLLAWQYQRAGVPIRALLDTTPRDNFWRALPHLPRALLAHHYVTKGLGYERYLRQQGIEILKDVSDLYALGDDRLRGVEFTHQGKRQRLDSSLLLVQFGLIPQTSLARVAGCEVRWDEPQQCWRPVVDDWCNSSVPGIGIVGDAAGIGGAIAAEHAGRIAGLEALRALGRLSAPVRDRLGKADRRWLRRDLQIRPFLETLFRLPPERISRLPDEVVVCRCEEVTAGQVRAAVHDGHRDPNQVKFLTRCGMGPCQGRQCSDSVAQLVAAETATTIAEIGGYRLRPPSRPLPVEALAGLSGAEDVGQ